MTTIAVDEETKVRLDKISGQIAAREGVRSVTFSRTLSFLCDMYEQQEAGVRP